MRILKQSTSVDVPIGPFLDSTDGITAESALTITQPDVRLKKNAGNWAQKAAAQTLTHEENGYYEVTLDATDTNTLGLLRLAVAETGAIPIWEDFVVVTAHVFDTFFSTDLFQVDVTQVAGSAVVATGGRPEVNATHWNGTAVATPDSAGHPKVTIKSGTGTGELSITSGIAAANATQINGVAASAVRLALSAGIMVPGTVDNTVAPTTTVFECDDITEATADHFNGRVIIFTSGALLYQQALISDYELVAGRGRFTVPVMTEAPANNDTLIIV